MTVIVSGGKLLGSAAGVFSTGSGASGFTPDAGITASGTFTDGQSVTLTKSAGGFGTKPGGAKAKYWLPLESDFSTDTTYCRTAVTFTPYSTNSISTTNKPANAAGASWQTVSVAESGTGTFVTNDPPFTFATQSPSQLYLYYESYEVANFANAGTDKILRVYPTAGSGAGQPDGYLTADSRNGGIDGTHAVFFEQSGDEDFLNDGWCNMLTNSGNWIACEFLYKDSTPSTQDGVASFIRNAVYGYSPSRLWTTRTVSTAIGSLYFNEYEHLDSNFAGINGYHAMLVDDSWCRVFVSTESTYAQGTNTAVQNYRAICLPTAWSDTSITLTLRKGQSSSLSGQYLWSVTNSGTAIRLGQFS